MLFLGSIDRILSHQHHILAAAGQWAAPRNEKFDDVAADIALVHFKNLGHDVSSSVDKVKTSGGILLPAGQTPCQTDSSFSRLPVKACTESAAPVQPSPG